MSDFSIRCGFLVRSVGKSEMYLKVYMSKLNLHMNENTYHKEKSPMKYPGALLNYNQYEISEIEQKY